MVLLNDGEDQKSVLQQKYASSPECIGFKRLYDSCVAKARAHPDHKVNCTLEFFDLTHCVESRVRVLFNRFIYVLTLVW